MANKCAHCSGTDLTTNLNTYTCLSCGNQTGMDGEVAAPGMDEGTRNAILARVAPRVHGLVGNYADVQRGGAAVLKGEGSISSGVEPPPGSSVEGIKADAKVAEKVDAALASASTAIAEAQEPDKKAKGK